MNQVLKNKTIIVGITGSIAAYKSAELVRRLCEAGANVHAVMTESAKQFITPLTLQALSGNPVHDHLLDTESERAMSHIQLARQADLIIIAPASANFIAHLAHGFADDLLTSICLATTAKIAIAPAMNQYMWTNQATQNNVSILKKQNILLWGPGCGLQACGENGPGRLIEVDEILALILQAFSEPFLLGKNIVVTAGPTREAIDPVRYLSNHSSGKMGYALAIAAVEAGANVTLISGPSHLTCPNNIQRIDVISAEDMYNAVMDKIKNCDIFISAAAVSDYRPSQIAKNKIKKHEPNMALHLEKNLDILSAVSALSQKPVVVGFAAETDNLLENAKQKLQDKKLDFIAANLVGVNQGFNIEENALTVIKKDGEIIELPTDKKIHLAKELLKIIYTNH